MRNAAEARAGTFPEAGVASKAPGWSPNRPRRGHQRRESAQQLERGEGDDHRAVVGRAPQPQHETPVGRLAQARWPELTLYLRAAGAPLDDNICERILKKAILHRKNALFYKTLNGARGSATSS